MDYKNTTVDEAARRGYGTGGSVKRARPTDSSTVAIGESVSTVTMSGAIIASCSLVFQLGLYWLLKTFLARRLFDRVLTSRGAAPLSERDVPHLAMM